ncbi:unnamed protein product, partial [Sphacelaria rigidula]
TKTHSSLEDVIFREDIMASGNPIGRKPATEDSRDPEDDEPLLNQGNWRQQRLEQQQQPAMRMSSSAPNLARQPSTLQVFVAGLVSDVEEYVGRGGYELTPDDVGGRPSRADIAGQPTDQSGEYESPFFP